MDEGREYGSASTDSDAAATVTCPVCRERGTSFYYRHGDIDLFDCGSCRTIFMDPMPTASAVETMYHDSYADTSTGYFTKVEKKMKRSRGRIRQLARYVSGGSFLDVGCNGGFMVEAAREHGFEACGVDLDAVSIDYARKHYPQNRFVHGTVESMPAEGSKYDLIYCSEVIEHVPDVQGFAAAVSSLLKPGGYFFITTPDISHWRRPRELTSWDAFNPPSHCIYFNPNSLKLLLEQHGLQVVSRRWAFKPGIKLTCRLG